MADSEPLTWRFPASGLAAVLITGCAAPGADGPPGAGSAIPVPPSEVVPRSEPRSKRGNPPYYEVFGKRYYVLDSSVDYRERGVASWYGTKFHGQQTSSGEIYDMHALTAAHKTLPLPTYAQVTNLRNGASVMVRINDRGPFVGNRIIDLSYTAARQLDMLRDGTTLVEIRAVQPVDALREPGPPAGTARAQRVYLQVGAFGQRENAEQMRADLALQGLDNVVVSADRVAGRPLYRVRVGPLADAKTVDTTLEQLRRLDIHDARPTAE